MPSYELAILYRALPKEKLADALKTTANLIFQEGGIIRKLNNLGTQATPWRMSSHGQVLTKASFFVYEFDVPTSSIQKLRAEFCKYDFIVKSNVFQPNSPIDSSSCKIEEEMQIAPFRKDVLDMLKRAKKLKEDREIGKVYPKTGLDFDPFPL